MSSKIIRDERVTMEEAMQIIMSDRTGDMLARHKGFLSDGDYPFEKPMIFDRGIVIWPPSHVHPVAKLGDHVMIGRYTNICGNIEIGNWTRIQGFCFIPDSVKIGNYVFIGPGVIFTNMKYPKVRDDRMKVRDGVTVIEDDARIGAGAIIGPGIRIGSRALIGMGAVVTKDVPPDTVVVGCPARGFGNESNTA